LKSFFFWKVGKFISLPVSGKCSGPTEAKLNSCQLQVCKMANLQACKMINLQGCKMIYLQVCDMNNLQACKAKYFQTLNCPSHKLA